LGGAAEAEDKTPRARSTWTGAAAALAASAAARQRFQGREESGLLPEDPILPEELSAAPRVALFPPAASSYDEDLTVAQQAKASAARAEAEVACPDEG